MQKIIGISGDAGVGKSTLARALGEHFNFGVPYSAFGEELRYWVSKQFNIPLELLKKKPTSPQIRRVLMRANSLKKTLKNEAIWVEQWEKHLYGQSTAVGDLRYMRELDGIIIFIGEPHDPWYQLEEIYAICDITLPVKPDFDPYYIRMIERAFKSYGH